VPRRDGELPHLEWFVSRREWVTFDVQRLRIDSPAQRDAIYGGGILHRGKGPKTVQPLPVERLAALKGLTLTPIAVWSNTRGEHVASLKAGIDHGQPPKRPDEETGGHHQHHRQGHFAYNKAG